MISTRTFVVSKDRGSVGSDTARGSLTLGLAPTHSSRGTKTPNLHPEGTYATPTEQPGLPGTSKTWQERHHLETPSENAFFCCCCFLQGGVLLAGKHGQKKERGLSWKPPAPSAGLGAQRRLFGQGDPAMVDSFLPAAPRTPHPPQADPIC